MSTTFESITRQAELISLPDIYIQLRNILDEPDFAMAEVAVVISQDPSLTLRLLHLVNSSFYSFTNKIETVSRAITLLGTEQIHDLVLATAVASAFKGMSTEVMDMQTFWQRSIRSAVIARRLAEISGKRDKERLFVAGLLHDIGHLIMYQAVPDLAERAIVQSTERNEPINVTERRMIGFDYAEVGGVLLRHWALPEVFRETTLCHIEPSLADQFDVESALVHIASKVTRAQEGEGLFNEGNLAIDGVTWEAAGITVEDCATLSTDIEDDIQQVMDVVFPRDNAA